MTSEAIVERLSQLKLEEDSAWHEYLAFCRSATDERLYRHAEPNAWKRLRRQLIVIREKRRAVELERQFATR